MTGRYGEESARVEAILDWLKSRSRTDENRLIFAMREADPGWEAAVAVFPAIAESLPPDLQDAVGRAMSDTSRLFPHVDWRSPAIEACMSLVVGTAVIPERYDPTSSLGPIRALWGAAMEEQTGLRAVWAYWWAIGAMIAIALGVTVLVPSGGLIVLGIVVIVGGFLVCAWLFDRGMRALASYFK